MLKIVVGEISREVTVLRLEGQVVGPWVDELERVCEPFLSRGIALSLDLGTVSFVSREGAALLRRLGDARARLLNCSRFVAEQLKAQPGNAREVEGSTRAEEDQP